MHPSTTYPLFLLLLSPPPRSTLFPYTTLFRSCKRWCLKSRPRSQTASFPRPRRSKRLRSLTQSPSPKVRHQTNSSVLELSTSSRSEEHTSELQSRGHLVCRLLLEKKKYKGRGD